MSTTKTKQIDELCTAAFDYRTFGLKVIPLTDGKKPTGIKEWQKRTFDDAEFHKYLASAKTPALGVQLGPCSGIIDVEWDTEQQRDKAYEIFGADLLDNCPAFGRPDDLNREHRLLKWDERLEAANVANLHIPCGDGEPLIVRIGAGGKGSQSAFPPSPNKVWRDGRELVADIEAPECSASVIATLLSFTKPAIEPQQDSASQKLRDDEASIEAAVTAMFSSTKNMEDANDGSKRMVVCINRCFDESLTDEAAIFAFRRYESERPFKREYDDARLIQELRRVEQSGRGREPSMVLTDASNAERLAREHGSDVRYVCKWKQWIIWDGKRWKADDSGAIYRLALKSVRSMRQEAAQIHDKDIRKLLWTHAEKSEARNRLDAMVSLAQKILPLPINYENMNKDAWLLNFDNGTLDLRTGELREHRRDDFITKIVPFDYPTSDVQPERWSKFLNRIFDRDAELIAFVQRLLGYSLVGEQAEHIFPVLWGGGQNGKSTLVGVIVTALGEYAMTLGQDYLMQSKNQRHSTEVMDLYQMRLAVSAETEEGARLNEARVKHQTGGGKIRGRRLFQESWEYTPSHTLFIETNHKPRIVGTDVGIWRRVMLVPFTVRIPDEEKDSDLPNKLTAEIPAILRWLVDGCLAWQRSGLNPPEAVTAATAKYRDESDLFAAFVNECCELGPQLKVRARDLYNEYATRARRRGETPVAASRVEDRLDKMGVYKRKIEKGQFLFGIRVKEFIYSYEEFTPEHNDAD